MYIGYTYIYTKNEERKKEEGTLFILFAGILCRIFVYMYIYIRRRILHIGPDTVRNYPGIWNLEIHLSSLLAPN